jgi:hypothetical protein
MPAFDFRSIPGYARSLNGSTDYFARADTVALHPVAQDFTFVAWVYLTAASGTIRLGGQWGAAGNRGWSASIVEAAGAIAPRLAVSGDGTTSVEVVTGVDLMNVNTWHQIVLAKQGTTLYAQVDNGTVYSQAGAAASVFASTADFALGAHSDGSAPVTGRMCKVSLFLGFIPSAAQLTAMYNAGLGRTLNTIPDDTLANLIVRCDGDEPSGNLLDRLSGYNFTAHGAPGTAAGPDTSLALSVAHPTKPAPNLGNDGMLNRVSSRAVGGRVRGQERGDAQDFYSTSWPVTTDAHVTTVQAWFDRYGGNAEPYSLELPDGSFLRCRCPQAKLPKPYAPRGWRAIGPIEHLEDVL